MSTRAWSPSRFNPWPAVVQHLQFSFPWDSSRGRLPITTEKWSNRASPSHKNVQWLWKCDQFCRCLIQCRRKDTRRIESETQPKGWVNKQFSHRAAFENKWKQDASSSAGHSTKAKEQRPFFCVYNNTKYHSNWQIFSNPSDIVHSSRENAGRSHKRGFEFCSAFNITESLCSR